MILTGHQPTYLPWLGLFNKIANSTDYIFFDDVQYLPKEWMNRNKVKGVNGEEIFLTVPVLRKDFLNKKTYEIKIDNSYPWKRKHLKTIEISYRKSKFFENYIDMIRTIYDREWDYLSDLNFYILNLILDILGIKVNIYKLSSLKVSGKKSDLVLNACKRLGAKKFIFGEQGRNYANLESFKENNIDVFFQEYFHPTYKQQGNNFVSHLSVIDLIFNCGNDALNIINNNQILKNK